MASIVEMSCTGASDGVLAPATDVESGSLSCRGSAERESSPSPPQSVLFAERRCCGGEGRGEGEQVGAVDGPLTPDPSPSLAIESGNSSLRGRGKSANWRRSLAEAVRDPDRLIDRLNLADEWRKPARLAARRFPLLVPESFLRRMRPGDPHDPLLRQVLPLGEELNETPGFGPDPVGDAAAHRSAGLLQKYHGRALLIATGSCAVHCRYCFRREYPYADEPRRLDDWKPALAALAGDSSVQEVILSGGDPLMLTDSRLGELIHRISAIPHVRRLRIHSRMPIVLPDRVADPLLQLLRETRLTPWMVLHANHPREIADDCADALRRLVSSGITTLNQAVLLRGVNDSVDTQAELSERLIDLGVVPYYLHQLDRVRGAAHFEVAEEVGAGIVEEMRRRLPGYAVPTYVRELADAPSKLTIR